MAKISPVIFIVFAFLVLVLIGRNEVSRLPIVQIPVVENVLGLAMPGTENAIPAFSRHSLCADTSWPVTAHTLASVYRIELPVATGANSLTLYQQAAINDLFSLVSLDRQRNCLTVQSAGRSLPFNLRFQRSIFPNVEFGQVESATEHWVILQDDKSRNLWLAVSPNEQFSQLADQHFLFSGFYLGALIIYAIAGFSIAAWQGSKLAVAYALYTLVIAFWYIQNFGLGAAFISFWPGPEYFGILQGLATALIVIGISAVCLSFLKLSRRVSLSLLALSLVIAGLFLSSAFFAPGYQYGAAGLVVMALIMLTLVVRTLGRRDSSGRLFALGLLCSISIGSLQAVSVLNGSNFFGFAIFAFPIGNFLEVTFWLLAIADRLFAEFKKIQLKMLFDATHDPLTQLPNRSLLENRIKEIVAQKGGATVNLLFIDLDRFKQINDGLGHANGDDILRRMAFRLRSCVPHAHTLARFGGDEFCVLLPGAEDSMAQFGTMIIDALSKPMMLEDRELYLSASIGVCTDIAQYANAETILGNADMALYAAKASGRGCTMLYHTELHRHEKEKFQIEQDILPAIRRGEFTVHFQPIVSLPSQKLAGFEALVRWQHPVKGWLAPFRFIQVAEDTGLIGAISDAVIMMVMQQIEQWQSQGLWQEHLYVSINIASQQLTDQQLLPNLLSNMAIRNIPTRAIRIEVTESTLVKNTDIVTKTLTAMREQGFKILIDDFGTGYSSFSYIHELPIDVLKIDRSFINEIEQKHEKRELVQSIIELANRLGFDVVAEGIEAEEQLQMLAQYGCSNGQGYLFDKPLCAEDITDRWLRTDRAHWTESS